MKARVLASATHLLASMSVISIFLSFVYFIWYPGPLSELHGVIDAIKVVIGVDIVLGPLLTLIIFDIRKPRKELVRDLTVIVLIQISALAWGAYTTLKVRPVFVVLYNGTMNSIARNDVAGDVANSTVTVPGFWQRPRQAYIPTLDPKEAIQQVQDMLTKGVPDIKYQVARYLPIQDHKQAVLGQALDMTGFLEKRDNRSQFDAFLQRQGGTKDKYAFYPLKYGRFKSIVGVSRDNLELTGLLAPVTAK